MRAVVKVAGLALLAIALLGLGAGCDNVLAEIERDASEVRLTVTTDGNGKVYQSRENPLHIGDTLEITAVPDAGFEFAGWECMAGEPEVEDTGSRVSAITVFEDCTIKANFAIQTFTLTVNHDGDCDSILINGGSSETSGEVRVEYGEWVDVEATPKANYEFVEWAVDGSGVGFPNDDRQANPTEVRLTEGDATITANASLDVYEVTVQSADPFQGTTTPSEPKNVEHNAWFDISAVAEDALGYEFDYWSESGPGTVEFEYGPDVAVQQIRVVGGDVLVVAHFRLKTYELTVGSGGNGSVTGSTSVEHGQWTTITATPDTDYHFTTWTTTAGTGVQYLNSDQSMPSTQVRLTSGDATVTANFSLDVHQLTVQSSNSAHGYVDPSGTHSVGQGQWFGVEAVAQAAAGYHFDHWEATGAGTVEYEVGPATAAQNVRVLDGNATLTAYFALNSYELTLTAGAHGSISGQTVRTVSHGSYTSITAVPDANYHFTGWQVADGAAAFNPSTGGAASATTEVMLTTGDAELLATFAIDQYQLSVTSANGAQGYVTPSGTYTVDHGAPFAVEAVPNDSSGYEFANWQTSGLGTIQLASGTTTDPTDTVRLYGGDGILTATFGLKTYLLTVTSASHGSATGGGEVTHGDWREISANPDSHYHPTGWTTTSGTVEYNSATGGQSSGTTEVRLTQGPATVRANFAANQYDLRVRATTPALYEEGLVLTGVQMTPADHTPVTYGQNQAIEVTDSRYILVRWYESGGANIANTNANPTTVSMTSAGEALASVEEFHAPSGLTGYYVSHWSNPYFQVNWTDNTTNEEGFRVRVVNYDKDMLSSTGDLPPDTTSATLQIMFLGELNYEPGDLLRVDVAAYRKPAGSTTTRYQWTDTISLSE